MTNKERHLQYKQILTEDFLRQQYIDLRKSTIIIASEVGVNYQTVNNYIRQFGIPLRTAVQSRSNPVNSSGFVDLTTDWHAYWVGFLAADGCVFIDKKKNEARLQLGLKMSDADHVRNFQQGINTKRPVVVGNDGKRDMAKIAINDRNLVDILAKWGIVPNKTLVMNWPSNLPPNMVPAYIRGYFDGDGTIFQRHRSAPGTIWTETVCRFISGSVPFLEALANELNKRGVQTLRIYRNQKSNAFFLPVSSRRENLLAFASVIYTGSTVCLERKRTIFQEMEAYHAANPRAGSHLRYQTG
jgi:hypothetical protein